MRPFKIHKIHNSGHPVSMAIILRVISSQCSTNQHVHNSFKRERIFTTIYVLMWQRQTFLYTLCYQIIILINKVCWDFWNSVLQVLKTFSKRRNGKHSSILSSTYTALINVSMGVRLWRTFHQPYNFTQVKWWFFLSNNKHELM